MSEERGMENGNEDPLLLEDVAEEKDDTNIKELSKILKNLVKSVDNLSAKIDESIQINKELIKMEEIKPLITTLKSVTNKLVERREPNIGIQRQTSEIINYENLSADETAQKIKNTMASLWALKMQKRKNAYWNLVKNNGHTNCYKDWINSTPIVLPRYLQKKVIPYEQDVQKKVREKATLHEFKVEIELKELRAEHNRELCHSIDNEMETLIEQKCTGPAQLTLKRMWQEEVKWNENISKRRWTKNDKWLTTYKDEFQRNHKDKSPFFKIFNNQRTYADAVKQTDYHRNTRQNNNHQHSNNLRNEQRNYTQQNQIIQTNAQQYNFQQYPNYQRNTIRNSDQQYQYRQENRRQNYHQHYTRQNYNQKYPNQSTI